MTKWEALAEIYKNEKLSDLEMMVAVDMLHAGYDYRYIADVAEYWLERLK